MLLPSMPQEELEKGWVFLKTPEKVVMLSIAAQGTFLPCIAFVTPEALYRFLQDVQKAWEEFVPLPVRQAIGTLDQYHKGGKRDNDNKPDNDNKGDDEDSLVPG